MPGKKLSAKMKWFRLGLQYLKIDARGDDGGRWTFEGNWPKGDKMADTMVTVITAMILNEDHQGFWKALGKFADRWVLKGKKRKTT